MTTEPTVGLASFAAQTDAGDAHWFLGHLISFIASAETTGGRVGVIDHVAPEGAATPFHMHHRDDEWFYVLEGSLTIWRGEEPIEAGAGSFVSLPRDLPHRHEVTSSGGARFLVGFEPPVGDGFVRACSEPASAFTLPPPSDDAPDLAAIGAIAAGYGIEFVEPSGPPA